ncbi:MAG: ferritin family protein [Anaerolineae bacterium]|nr:ferritin family protein [Anaerolineae bacterium]
MENEVQLTPLEALGIAIKAEIEAAETYERLANLVKNRALKEKAHFLQGEELKHRALLEEAYARQFPDVELALSGQSLVPRVEAALEGEVSVPELLALAMQAEQASERFYADLARRSQSESARVMFQHLSRMEGSHFHLLRVEHDLATRFPDYYNVEEFHFGDELIHLGP